MTGQDEFHPVANVWPMLSDAELKSLADDIAANGLHYAIWRHADGRIIDGRNRWLACQIADVECPSNIYQGQDGAPLISFVVGLNDKRRHMNESQRAMVANKIANIPLGANQHTADHGSANLPTLAVSQIAAADMLKVGERSVRDARKVQSKGVPELARAVEQGAVAVSTAAQIADAPPDEQRKLIAEGKKAMAQEAAKRRADKRKSAKPKPTPQQKPRPNALPEKPEHLRFLELWLQNGVKMVEKFGAAEDAVALADQYQVFIRPDETRIVCDFLNGLSNLVEVDRAA